MPTIDIHAGKGSVRKVMFERRASWPPPPPPVPALAGETEAKAMLKAMTDYMARQKELSFRYALVSRG